MNVSRVGAGMAEVYGAAAEDVRELGGTWMREPRTVAFCRASGGQGNAL